MEVREAVGRERTHADDVAFAILDELGRGRPVVERRAVALEDREVALLQSVAAAVHEQDVVGRHVEAARGHPVVALGCEPLHGRKRLGHVHLEHLLVALVVGDAHDFVPQHVFGALRHALEQPTQLIVGRASHQRTDVFEAVEDEPHVAGQRAVAPAFALLRLLEDADLRALLQGGMGGTARRVACTHDEHVVVVGLIRHRDSPGSPASATQARDAALLH